MTIRNDILIQLYAIAPAPCRDYYGLTVTDTRIILNIWNISYGPHIYPKCNRSTLEEFHEDRYLQNDIKVLFGQHVLNFCQHLASNDHNLQYLPTKIFLGILKHLAARDILALSQTSKIFFELCNTDAVWKIIFRKKLRRPISFEDCKTAGNTGWKKALMSKISKRFDIKTMSFKKSMPRSQDIQNNTKMTTGYKKNNIDIVQNLFTYPILCKNINPAVIREPSKTDTKAKAQVNKNIVLKNDMRQTNNVKSPVTISRSNHNINLNITTNIKIHPSSAPPKSSARQKTTLKPSRKLQ